MYVCLCNGYRESEISEVAREGVRCAKTAYLKMGYGPRCGQCLDMAQDIIDEVHGTTAAERCAPSATSVSKGQRHDYAAKGSEVVRSSEGQATFSDR